MCHEYLINHSRSCRLVAYFTWIYSYQDKVVVDCKLIDMRQLADKWKFQSFVCPANNDFFFKMIINARHFCYHKLCCAVQFFWLVYKNCICECLKIKCYNFCWILFLCSRADPGGGGVKRALTPPPWKIQTCQIYIFKSQKMGPDPQFPSKTKLFLERTKAGNLDPCILHCFVNNWRDKNVSRKYWQ